MSDTKPPQTTVDILFVCLGNICRSPTAEAVMMALVDEAGLSETIAVDSAGTGSWHIGERPDGRAEQAALRRGIELRGTARQVDADDFERFDLIVAMDRSNLSDLARLAPDDSARAKLRLLREFDPDASWGSLAAPNGAGVEADLRAGVDLDVPDPYHGGAEGFDQVLDLVERCCAVLLENLAAGDGATPPPASA